MKLWGVILIALLILALILARHAIELRRMMR